ncbi:tRNA pseudouridine(13) synthase TruD [Pinirhizobacter sp.]|jgi:tRNA pseudouridine13 synthase|uniref:tRNA pseudouridine(13) synthase TruD n=1 Tax=Pinirhizobacter sp. TaxID=2950432 RepID=UPI002F42C792
MSLDLPFAHGGPSLTGRLRSSPDDFRVEEILGYGPDGEGEHVFLEVEKRGENTEWVAKELARFAGANLAGVGFAGLKDRHAVTVQAISVQLPGKDEPDWSAFGGESVTVRSLGRTRRKIKRGALRGNRFVITLRGIEGDRAIAQARLSAIVEQGVPNYFGEQRFGREAGNIGQARAMFGGRRVDRSKRSMLLSAARSHLFNAVLAERVLSGHWATPIEGEVYALAGSRSFFGPEPTTDALAERLASFDIHPSGPLWGRGEPPTSHAAAELELRIAAADNDLAQGLAAAGMDQERRALRLHPDDLTWRWLDDAVEVTFALPAGAYATTVLREVAQF